MNQWYAMVNDLQTQVPALDELARKRICGAALAAIPKRRSKWKLALIAAAILLLTACGVVVSQYAHWFGTLVQDPFAPERSEDLLASMGTSIEQRQTVGGVTVILHGALYDGSTFLLSLSVEGLEPQERYTSHVEAETGWLYYSRADAARYWAEQQPESAEQYLDQYDRVAEFCTVTLSRQYDPACCLLLAEPMLMPEEGREVALHLENLTVQGQTLEGTLEFVFTPEKKDVSRTLFGTAAMTTEDGTPYTVTGIRITPLAIEVTVCGQMDSQGQPPDKTPMIEGVRLSGEDWTWSSKSYARVENAGNGIWEGKLSMGHLERVIDPRSVEAVKLNGTWLELQDLKG